MSRPGPCSIEGCDESSRGQITLCDYHLEHAEEFAPDVAEYIAEEYRWLELHREFERTVEYPYARAYRDARDQRWVEFLKGKGLTPKDL